MPYGVSNDLWRRLPSDDQAAVIATSEGLPPPAIGGYAPVNPAQPTIAATPSPPPTLSSSRALASVATQTKASVATQTKVQPKPKPSAPPAAKWTGQAKPNTNTPKKLTGDQIQADIEKRTHELAVDVVAKVKARKLTDARASKLYDQGVQKIIKQDRTRLKPTPADKVFSAFLSDAGTIVNPKTYIKIAEHPKGAAVGTYDFYKQLLEHPGRTFQQHPLFTILAVKGALKGASETAKATDKRVGGPKTGAGKISVDWRKHEDGYYHAVSKTEPAGSIIPRARIGHNHGEGARGPVVPLFHGSRHDYTSIKARGLDPQHRGPTSTSRDIRAARDAIGEHVHPSHETGVGPRRRDPGIVLSNIPKDVYDEHLLPVEFGGYRGFEGGKLRTSREKTTETRLRTSVHKSIFNKYIDPDWHDEHNH